MDPQTTLTITGKTQDEQSGALDFGANYEKNTTMCLPCIKLAWPQYIINVFKNYLSVTEVSEKEALISLPHMQNQRTQQTQRLPKEYGKKIVNSNSFFAHIYRCLFAFH